MASPTKRITDPRFKYTPAVRTDVAKTFARIRREQEAANKERAAAVVQPIRRAAK